MLEPLKTLHIAIIKFNLFNLNYTQKDRPTSWKPNYRYLVVTRKLCSTKGVSLLDNAWWKVLCVVVVFRDQAQGISATAHPPPPRPRGAGEKARIHGFHCFFFLLFHQCSLFYYHVHACLLVHGILKTHTRILYTLLYWSFKPSYSKETKKIILNKIIPNPKRLPHAKNVNGVSLTERITGWLYF